VIVATDRISAFDHVLGSGIRQGKVLTSFPSSGLAVCVPSCRTTCSPPTRWRIRRVRNRLR